MRAARRAMPVAEAVAGAVSSRSCSTRSRIGRPPRRGTRHTAVCSLLLTLAVVGVVLLYPMHRSSCSTASPTGPAFLDELFVELERVAGPVQQQAVAGAPSRTLSNPLLFDVPSWASRWRLAITGVFCRGSCAGSHIFKLRCSWRSYNDHLDPRRSFSTCLRKTGRSNKLCASRGSRCARADIASDPGIAIWSDPGRGAVEERIGFTVLLFTAPDGGHRTSALFEHTYNKQRGLRHAPTGRWRCRSCARSSVRRGARLHRGVLVDLRLHRDPDPRRARPQHLHARVPALPLPVRRAARRARVGGRRRAAARSVRSPRTGSGRRGGRCSRERRDVRSGVGSRCGSSEHASCSRSP